jgi:hypothetical protein
MTQNGGGKFAQKGRIPIQGLLSSSRETQREE